MAEISLAAERRQHMPLTAFNQDVICEKAVRFPHWLEAVSEAAAGGFAGKSEVRQTIRPVLERKFKPELMELPLV